MACILEINTNVKLEMGIFFLNAKLKEACSHICCLKMIAEWPATRKSTCQ